MEVVFLKTRWEYQSYTDFWELVRLGGFEVRYLDELEPGREAVYVFSPKQGELESVLPRLKGEHACKVAWWCLERPDADGSITESKAIPAGLDVVWLSDAWLARRHTFYGWGPVRWVPVGSNESLGTPGNGEYLYDWADLSYATGRRQEIYRQLKGQSLGNCWGEERDRGLKGTRLMVNVHQDDWSVLEPLRFALAAAYGLPILSERIDDPAPYREGYDFVQAGYLELPGRINAILDGKRENGRSDFWRMMGLRARERMCGDFEFGRCVKEAAWVLAK